MEKLPPVVDGERISIAQDRDVCVHVDRLHKTNKIENIKARKAKDSERGIKGKKIRNKQTRIEEKDRRQKG